MPKAVAIEDFTAKLRLVCKHLNWSRARLAQQIGMDKSLAGRWLAGTSRPTGNSLMRLNDALARALPGFTGAIWDMAAADLARRFGLPSTGTASAEVAPSLATAGVLANLKAFSRQTTDIDLLSGIYAGFYRVWFASFANDGAIRHGAARLWRDGDALRAEVAHHVGVFAGGCIVAGDRLYLILEIPTFDGLSFTSLGGPRSRHPRWLTGITTYHLNRVAAGGFAATPTVLEFIQPTGDDREADERLWRKLQGEIAEKDKGRAAIAPEIARLLRPVIGAPHPDGSIDRLLTVPPLA